MLTCDYERISPQASPLERELHTQSLNTLRQLQEAEQAGVLRPDRR
jgi:hypothetical protein